MMRPKRCLAPGVLILSVVGFSQTAFPHAAPKIAEEVVKQTVPRWVPEIIQGGTQAAPRCVPFLGRTFGAAAGAAFAFCAFPDNLADGTLTGRTIVRAGFAAPHAVTSDELIDYFRKHALPVVRPGSPAPGVVRNMADSPNNGSKPPADNKKKKPTPKEIEDLLADVRGNGPKTAAVVDKARSSHEDIWSLLTLAYALPTSSDILEKLRADRIAVEGEEEGVATWNTAETLDRTYFYFVGLATHQLLIEKDFTGFRKTCAVLEVLAEVYGQAYNSDAKGEFGRIANGYIEGMKGIRANLAPARLEQGALFPVGTAVKPEVAHILEELRREAKIPNSILLRVRVSGLEGTKDSPDLATLRAFVRHLWFVFLKDRHAEELVVRLDHNSTGGTIGVVSFAMPTPDDDAFYHFLNTMGWMTKNEFGFGLDHITGGPEEIPQEVGRYNIRFQLNDRWLWQEPLSK